MTLPAPALAARPPLEGDARPVVRFHTERFATRVRKWRGSRTQACAAAELGMSRWALSRVECGGMPGALDLLALCVAMRCDPREFVYVQPRTTAYQQTETP